MRQDVQAVETKATPFSAAQSDALVLFGVTGGLGHKMMVRALCATAKPGVLDVPAHESRALSAGNAKATRCVRESWHAGYIA